MRCTSFAWALMGFEEWLGKSVKPWRLHLAQYNADVETVKSLFYDFMKINIITKCHKTTGMLM